MTKRSHSDYLTGDHHEQANKIKRPSIRRQHSLVSRFESLRRQYSENDYYDPYQKEQAAQQQGKRKLMDDDEDYQGSMNNEEYRRPTKRRKSITTMIKNGVIQGVLFGSAMALTAIDYLQTTTTPFIKRRPSFLSIENLNTSSNSNNNDNGNNKQQQEFWIKHQHDHQHNNKKQHSKNGFSLFYNKFIMDQHQHQKNMRGHGVDFTYFPRSPTFGKRMEKTEEMIRSICLDQQDALNQHFSFTSLLKKDDHCWGIIDKDNYGVDFTSMPPPKPKHSFNYLQKQKSLFF
ncbi:hypothetical protein BJ944DRAFT_288282 [Cunninghamella echinulata]|nr:hypothetical protein BJ944DRAFT_288282 [Cunninghamella echinulata]